jgi:hypothetical protein
MSLYAFILIYTYSIRTKLMNKTLILVNSKTIDLYDFSFEANDIGFSNYTHFYIYKNIRNDTKNCQILLLTSTTC